MLTSTLIRITAIPRHASGSLHLFVGFHPLGTVALSFGVTGFLLGHTEQLVIDGHDFFSTCSSNPENAIC